MLAEEILGSVVVFIGFTFPLYLSIVNVKDFLTYQKGRTDKHSLLFLEIFGILISLCYLVFYMELSNFEFVSYTEVLNDYQFYFFINPDHFLTIVVLFILSFIGYLILRFTKKEKLTPIIAAFSVAFVYIGIALMAITFIQTIKDYPFILFSLNIALLYSKTLLIFTVEKADFLYSKNSKFKKLNYFIVKTENYPFIGMLFILPVLAIVIIILILFGQEPSSIIKAWTETAEWTFSQKIAPEKIPYDSHYLCTVSAKGHRKIVKPLRTGIRHNHLVMVNRQLMIANAFEEVLSEKLPKTHKIIRKFYDKYAYPISNHINSKIVSDIIYILMKPLEWIFLLVLYTFDTKPENRIAVQYPHSKIPIYK